MVATLLIQSTSTAPPGAAGLFARGRTFDEFVAHVASQRDIWRRTAAAASAPRDLVDRLERVGDGLQLLVVAEDWCPDSANTVPYIAALASQAHVALRIVDRDQGQSLMKRYPAGDGRAVTPTVVVIRGGSDVAAWVERPAPLQHLFQTMATSADSARQFADRQAWYDADRGRTTLAEVVALAERTAVGRRL
jgi:hypothetical protein